MLRHIPLENITQEDILSLIDNEVRENREIEYKRDLPGNSKDDKREFLADVSSFANASGGDLFYEVGEGEGEEKGLPKKPVGVDCDDKGVDEITQRLENMIRDSIEPRIGGLQVHKIKGFEKGPVLKKHLQPLFDRSGTPGSMCDFLFQYSQYSRTSTLCNHPDCTAHLDCCC